MGPDGRGNDQSIGTYIGFNLAREFGLWQKQSSFYFQAVGAKTVLQGNVIFNIPRAALNFNDGFGGGDEIHMNLLLNTCRESGDHGPWNSWDRVPYITTIRNGTASIVPATRNIHHNFVIANYNSVSAIDNDDGSAYYNTHHNVFAYGGFGLKCDFGGHDNVWSSNILAYTSSCWSLEGYFKFYNMGFKNNTCILTGNNTGYTSTGGVSGQGACGSAKCCPRCCGGIDKSFARQVGSNQIHTQAGHIDVCGLDFDKWQSAGNDVHSTVSPWPADARLAAAAKGLLGWGA